MLHEYPTLLVFVHCDSDGSSGLAKDRLCTEAASTDPFFIRSVNDSHSARNFFIKTASVTECIWPIIKQHYVPLKQTECKLSIFWIISKDVLLSIDYYRFFNEFPNCMFDCMASSCRAINQKEFTDKRFQFLCLTSRGHVVSVLMFNFTFCLARVDHLS